MPGVCVHQRLIVVDLHTGADHGNLHADEQLVGVSAGEGTRTRSMSSETDSPDVGFDGWHCLAAAEVAARLGVDPLVGLPVSEAVTRLDALGPNRLPRGKKRSAFRAFIDQFRSFLVAVLVGAAWGS